MATLFTIEFLREFSNKDERRADFLASGLFSLRTEKKTEKAESYPQIFFSAFDLDFNLCAKKKKAQNFITHTHKKKTSFNSSDTQTNSSVNQQILHSHETKKLIRFIWWKNFFYFYVKIIVKLSRERAKKEKRKTINLSVTSVHFGHMSSF